MSAFWGANSIMGIGQASSFPVVAVQRSCPSASLLYKKEKQRYLDEDRYSFGNVKQSSRTKISQRCWCKSNKFAEKNPDNGCGPEKNDVSQATLIWRAIKLPIYSVAVVPLTVAGAAAYLQTGQFAVGRYLGLLVSSIFIITWLNLSNDVYDFDTGADKNKKESVVNIVGSRIGTLVAANLLLAFGFAGLIGVAFVAGNMRSILLLFCAVMCGYVYQVEGDREVGKFSPLVRIGQKAGSEVVKIAIVALYCALFVLSLGNALPLTSTFLCALTLPMGNMVVSFMEDNYHDNEKIFMAKYYCVRLHALFGVALTAGLVAARRLGNYAPRPIFL